MEPSSGPSRAGVPIEAVPIFDRSGHSDGPSLPKWAAASLHADWPSAASGLIVSPAGRLRATALSDEGVGVNPSVWGTLNPTSSPEAESAASVVRFVLRTGLNVNFSQPVDAG